MLSNDPGGPHGSVSPRILLVDTVGELGAWWGTATIAYVGGSMGPRNGQNMIEPAGYGAAVVFGLAHAVPSLAGTAHRQVRPADPSAEGSASPQVGPAPPAGLIRVEVGTPRAPWVRPAAVIAASATGVR